MNPHLSKIQHKANIFFVRHAETEHNKEHRIAGAQNSNLTERGIAQATFTGNFFQDKNISVILHSSLERTHRTATLIKNQIENSEIPFILCNELIEINSGIWTHKKLIDMEQQDPVLFALFRRYSWECVPEAEKITSLVNRCDIVWKTICNLIEQGHSNILAVTHGGFLNWIFKTSFAMEGAHLESWSPVIKTDNCGIYELSIETSTEGAFCFWKTINHTCYK